MLKSASRNNAIGVAGVAGGDGLSNGALIMTSVIFGDTQTGGIEAAFAYGAQNGAKISSNSWGKIIITVS